MSDSHNLASHIFVDGTMHLNPPLPRYEEIASLKSPFPVSKLYSIPPIEDVAFYLFRL